MVFSAHASVPISTYSYLCLRSGVGQTEPFNCYNDTERTVTRLKQRLTDVGGPEDESLLARSWASMKSYATDCLTSDESAPDIAEVIGTGYVARDLMLMVDSIVGNGCLLNFWGLSYGTVLGTTVSALFPDRIGRVVLDGNVNIPEYYHGFELEWFRDADAAVFDFFERCTDAGPELCQLAGRNESARILNGRFYEALDALRTAPIPMGTTFVLDQTALKTGLRIALYGTESFPQLAATFDELFKSEKDRNSTALAEAWLPLATASDLGDTLPDDSATGIFCGDKTIRTEEFGDVFPDMTKRFRAVSRSLGDMANGLSFPCLRWPWHAKGGYNGSWHDEVETKNPILFIGNTYDPVTPISNAHNSSAIFTGSSVLENGGVGHGSFAHSSRCTAKVIRAYFNEGKLPERGLKCEADFGAFEPGKSWKDYMLPESDYV